MKYLYQIKRKIKEPKTQTKIIKYRVQNELIKEYITYITKEEAKAKQLKSQNKI